CREPDPSLRAERGRRARRGRAARRSGKGCDRLRRRTNTRHSRRSPASGGGERPGVVAAEWPAPCPLLPLGDAGACPRLPHPGHAPMPVGPVLYLREEGALPGAIRRPPTYLRLLRPRVEAPLLRPGRDPLGGGRSRDLVRPGVAA